MRMILSVFLVAALMSQADSACTDMEMQLGEAMKLSFSGYNPTVKRITNTGVGNKVVLKGFDRTPVVNTEGALLSIAAGDPCSTSPVAAPTGDSSTGGSSATMAKLFGLALPFLVGGGKSTCAVGTTAAVALTAGYLLPGATAQDVSQCDLAPIEVEIYVDATADEIVMRDAQSGDFEVCPTESLYWKHHPNVYGGYEGCVGEIGYYPCPQDSAGLEDEEGELAAMYPLKWSGSACESTGYTTENRTYWVLWGDPQDKYELNMRTGFNPVVQFPFNRGPYPTYANGVSTSTAIDDSNDAREMAKDLLAYLGAFTADELGDWEVTMTEGAESGMVAIWGAKALEIAQTTCNRDIYVLSQVPSYGYSSGDAASLANKFSSTFYNGTECLCYNTSSCFDPTVTVSMIGWLPLTPLPTAVGGDGITYSADSSSASSPWIESMVFPENPSGAIKTPQLSDSNRRVCDGVYVWPQYFGMTGYKIPLDKRPDCAAWSFSITKAYSASVRAGFIIYKSSPTTNLDAMADVMGELYSMTNGLYSEWSWYGQMQLWEMIMSRPMTDGTSWIGAYTSLMEEKWNLIIDGFANCPVVTVTNPKAGAYVWFQYLSPYLGLQSGFSSSFFRDVLGVLTTTYNWGFRGADPADYYGEGYTTTDFTRLQLFRDLSVYKEVSRRAKIVCADPDATIGSFVSINQWAAGQSATRARRLTEGYANREERKRHLMEVVPGLQAKQLEVLAASHEHADELDFKVESACAPEYSTNCLFKVIGTRLEDF